MIQKSCSCYDQKEIEAAFADAGVRYRAGNFQSGLTLLFCQTADHPMIEQTLALARRELPGVPCAGITLYRGAAPGGLPDRQPLMRLSFLFFASARVHALCLPCATADTDAAAQVLREAIDKTREVAGVLLFPAGRTLQVSRFMERVSAGHEEIPFFGAVANAGAPEGTEGSLEAFGAAGEIPCAIGGRLVEQGIVAVLFSGNELQIKADYVLGWKPIGKAMEIEHGAPGAFGDTAVAMIDGHPAVSLYRRYLRVTPNRYFVDNVCEFPIVLERDGCLLSRVPAVYGEDGSLYLMGDIREGEKIRLSYGKREEILASSAQEAEEMRRFDPQAILLVLCGNRLIFLKEEAGIEYERFHEYQPETAFCHGLSELWRYRGQGGVLNSAMVAVGFREGGEETADSRCDTEVRLAPHTHEDGPIPLEERLVSFMEAMTEELVVAYADAAMMREAAESASRAKSAFLSSMSHEIRTPINAVLGMDEMILRETTEEAVRGYAENIRSAGTTLLGLVNDILDFSKIEAGKLEIIEVDYDLASVLNDLVNMIRPRAEGKGLFLTVRVDSRIPHLLHGDEIRIKQVLTNILTNAVKYTKEGGVTLSAALAERKDGSASIRFAVTDTGIGIKEEDISRLYTAFERIEEERNRTIEGTGLGMNITTELLSLMDSELEVESVYGEGSTFSFVLAQGVVKDDPIGDYEETLRRASAGRERYHEAFRAPDARILVVDDTRMNLTVFTSLLKKTGLQIDTAASGDECLAMSAKRKYDVIFLDHRMPGKDGIETLALLRADGANPNNAPADRTPVISLTANAVSGAREEYIAAGFDDYMTKPIDPDKLERLLLSFLPPDRVLPAKDRAAEGAADQAGDAAGEEAASEAVGNGEARSGEDTVPLPDFLLSVEELDASAGIAHCGDAETWLRALTDYAQAARETADAVERYLGEANWKDYTTRVHALKSTSRVIGATVLGDLAAALEDAGNRGEEETIRRDTPALLERFRALTAALVPLLDDEPEEEGLPEISGEAFDDAMRTVAELAASFDYESVLAVMEMLKAYRFPAGRKKRMERLRRAVARPDWDEIAAIAGESEPPPQADK